MVNSDCAPANLNPTSSQRRHHHSDNLSVVKVVNCEDGAALVTVFQKAKSLHTQVSWSPNNNNIAFDFPSSSRTRFTSEISPYLSVQSELSKPKAHGDTHCENITSTSPSENSRARFPANT